MEVGLGTSFPPWPLASIPARYLGGRSPLRALVIDWMCHMSASEQKVVQYLGEARASENALVRVLQSQIAMTPRGSYRSGLETHLRETRERRARLTLLWRLMCQGLSTGCPRLGGHRVGQGGGGSGGCATRGQTLIRGLATAGPCFVVRARLSKDRAWPEGLLIVRPRMLSRVVAGSLPPPP